MYMTFEHECDDTTIQNPGDTQVGVEAPYYDAFAATFQMPAALPTSTPITAPITTVAACGGLVLSIKTPDPLDFATHPLPSIASGNLGDDLWITPSEIGQAGVFNGVTLEACYVNYPNFCKVGTAATITVPHPCASTDIIASGPMSAVPSTSRLATRDFDLTAEAWYVDLKTGADDDFPATAPNCGEYEFSIQYPASPAPANPVALSTFITLVDDEGTEGNPATPAETIRVAPTLAEPAIDSVDLELSITLVDYSSATAAVRAFTIDVSACSPTISFVPQDATPTYNFVDQSHVWSVATSSEYDISTIVSGYR
jgi:hypothetical protein